MIKRKMTEDTGVKFHHVLLEKILLIKKDTLIFLRWTELRIYSNLIVIIKISSI
jgi:hypothetical protein